MFIYKVDVEFQHPNIMTVPMFGRSRSIFQETSPPPLGFGSTTTKTTLRFNISRCQTKINHQEQQLTSSLPFNPKTMTEEEEILKFYQLNTPNPQSWTQDTTVPSVSISQHKQQTKTASTANSSPFTAAAVNGFQIHEDDGLKMLLQLVNEDLNYDSNPIDPLNPAINIKNVVSHHNNGTTADDLLKFSINSKQFNSKNFLKVIHKDDSFEQLTASLNILDRSISEKNRELQKLIEGNHLKFLRSKFSIDDVLKQFGEYNQKEFQLSDLTKSIGDTNKDSTLTIKPIVANKQKEMKLRQSLEFVEKHKLFFNLSKRLKEYIDLNDYDNFIHDYKFAKQEMEKLNHKVINRIWEDIENLVDNYKNSLWNSLNERQDQNSNILNDDLFAKIVKKLLELDSIDNPILQWIEFQFNAVSKNISQCFKSNFDKLLNYQLNIQTNYNDLHYDHFKSTLVLLSNVVDNASTTVKSSDVVTGLIDNYNVIEMWLTLTKLVNELNDIMTKFQSTYKTFEKFLNGEIKIQSKYIDTAQTFLTLNSFELEKITKEYHSLIFNKIISRLFKIFNSTQETFLQDASIQQNTKGDLSAFGFLPPNTNSLSSLKYCMLITKSVNKILTNLGQFHKLNDAKSVEKLRECSQIINERIISGVCAALINDCSQFYRLENWTLLNQQQQPPHQKKQLTLSSGTYVPSLIQAFQDYVIKSLEALLFHQIPKLGDKEVTVVRFPNRKILTGVEVQFLRSLDVLLESIIKKIVEDNNNGNSNGKDDNDDEPESKKIKNLRNFHKLLTLLNIQSLNQFVFPRAISEFDRALDTQLTNANLEIYQLLKKMETTIFEAYLKDQHKIISKILASGFNTSSSSTKSDLQISSFIYELLNSLNSVYIKTHQVSPSLVKPVIVNLLEYISSHLLKLYRSLPSSNRNIQQCVLDIQFLHGIVGQSIKGNRTISMNLQLIYKALFDRGDDYQDVLKIVQSEILEILEIEIEASRVTFEIFNVI